MFVNSVDLASCLIVAMHCGSCATGFSAIGHCQAFVPFLKSANRG